jgi:1-acyl-sn-glycerol-3-phosphate acyltransferase
MILINLIQLFLIALWTFIVCYVIAPFLNCRGAYWLTVHIWAPGVAVILMSRIKIKGKENIRPDQHYIFMGNHESYFDIACMYHATKRNLHFVAKEELKHMFFTGYMLRKLQTIFVDRKSAQQSTASLKKAVDLIKQGKNVGIFPEGTRSNAGELAVFRKGGFKLAINSQTPIIPVAIERTGIAWPRNNKKLRPTTVYITFGPEISVENMTEENTKELVDKVQDYIKSVIIH